MAAALTRLGLAWAALLASCAARAPSGGGGAGGAPAGGYAQPALERCMRWVRPGQEARRIGREALHRTPGAWVRVVSWRRARAPDDPADAVSRFLALRAPLPTCAVVGSAPLLRGARRGREIDAHELVLRFNFAPTRGHEADVGARTDVRLMAHAWVPAEPTPAAAAQLLVLHRYHHPDFARDDAAANGNYSVGELVARPALRTGRTSKMPSSGFAGVLLALRSCGRVSLHGFDLRNQSGPGHYYDERADGLVAHVLALLRREPWRATAAPSSVWVPRRIREALAAEALAPELRAPYLAAAAAHDGDFSHLPSGGGQAGAQGVEAAYNAYVAERYARPTVHNIAKERKALLGFAKAGCFSA